RSRAGSRPPSERAPSSTTSGRHPAGAPSPPPRSLALATRRSSTGPTPRRRSRSPPGRRRRAPASRPQRRVELSEEQGAAVGFVGLPDRRRGALQAAQRPQEATVGLVLPAHEARPAPALGPQPIETTVVADAE